MVYLRARDQVQLACVQVLLIAKPDIHDWLYLDY
jgi:hypothetical protein